MSDPHARPERPPVLVSTVPAPGEAAHAVAARDLDARVRTVVKQARVVRHRDDAEAVHDLRVAARRLEAALELWRPLLDDAARRHARRRTRRIRRGFTPLRDLEVLRDEWRERLRGAGADEHVVLEAMISRLDRREAALEAKSIRHVARPRLRRLERVVRAALAPPPAAHPPVTVAALAELHVRAARERALAALEHGFAERSEEALHAARLKVKKWRYAEEARHALLDGRTSAVVTRLREMQDALGRAHDLGAAAAACARRARKSEKLGRHAAGEALRRLAAAIAHDRTDAIAEAQRFGTTLSGVTPPAARTGD